MAFKVGDRVIAHDDIDDLENIVGTLASVGPDQKMGSVRWDGVGEIEPVSLAELKHDLISPDPAPKTLQ